MSYPTTIPPSSSGQLSTPSPSHGGSTDPNEVRRRTQHTQIVSSQPSTPSTHGADTDPNELRMQQVHYSSSQSSSPPPQHGGNADPNEIRQRLGQSQSATPLLRDQAGSFTATRVVSSQESTVQYSTPSPSPYGGNINPSLGPLQPTRLDQPPNQAQSGYFQQSQINQPLGDSQFQHAQTPGAVSPPPVNYGSPLSQMSSQSFPTQTPVFSNQQNNAYGGQSSQIPQGVPPQVRTHSLLVARGRIDKASRAMFTSQ